MEGIDTTQVSEGAIESEQEMVSLEQAEEQLASQQEQGDINNQNELLQRKEEIEQRILEIQKEREEKEKLVEAFIQDALKVINALGNPVAQMEQIRKNEFFISLPQGVQEEIEENFKKYQFIDYKLAEVFLEEDPLLEELAQLTEEQQNLQEQRATDIQEEIIPETPAIEQEEIIQEVPLSEENLSEV